MSFCLLVAALRVTFEAMPVLLYPLFAIVIGFSPLVYYVEPQENIAAFAEACGFFM